ncbi:MAG: branched-chain amino acid ABC transporter permease [Betaproteobacteria bacterium]|nr:branched-chain amino acid ABC transporter permease [Betaproteobacteria bacterium]
MIPPAPALTAGTPRRGLALAAALAVAALAAFPFAGSDFYIDFVTRMMILALFAMSLDLLIGVAGMVSLGHAGFFGLAGYALALLSPDSGPVSLWWSLPAVLAVSALAALLIGALVVRTRGIYFIMVTLAFSQMLYFVVHDSKLAGGSDGRYLYFKPSAALLGTLPFDLEAKRTFYWFVLVCVVLCYLFLRRLLGSPFGRALAGIRINEHRMRALGFGTGGYKLAAFTLSGTLAGLAGYLWAAQTGFVNPELLGFHQSAAVIMMVILGGPGQFAGAALGAFAYEGLLFYFKDVSKHWQLLMGGLIVLLVLFAPRGLMGLLDRLRGRAPT